MMRKMYAGPLPESPVTASSCASSSTTVTCPRLEDGARGWRGRPRSRARRREAVAPAPTVAGVLGMARTMRMPECSRRSMAAMGTPAATQTTSFSREMSGEMPRSTWSRICGFTQSTTTSLSRAASGLVPPRTP